MVLSCFRVQIGNIELKYGGVDAKLKNSHLFVSIDSAHRYRTFRTQKVKSLNNWQWNGDKHVFEFEYKTKFPESLHLQRLYVKIVQVGWLIDTTVAHAFVDLQSFAAGKELYRCLAIQKEGARLRKG